MINKDKQSAGLFYPERKPVFHLVPPNIMGEEQNVSVLISQAVELQCEGDAVPPPTLTWLKDGRPLLKKPGLSVSANGSVLKVRLEIHFLLIPKLLVLVLSLLNLPVFTRVLRILPYKLLQILSLMRYFNIFKFYA